MKKTAFHTFFYCRPRPTIKAVTFTVSETTPRAADSLVHTTHRTAVSSAVDIRLQQRPLMQTALQFANSVDHPLSAQVAAPRDTRCACGAEVAAPRPSAPTARCLQANAAASVPTRGLVSAAQPSTCTLATCSCACIAAATASAARCLRASVVAWVPRHVAERGGVSACC